MSERTVNERKKTKCPASKKCGACQYIDVVYETQLSMKQKRMEELLGKFAKVKPIVGMEHPEHYRNKVHAVFSYDRKKGVVSGIYEEGTHKVVPVDFCLLENEKADEIIVAIRGMLQSFKIRIYDEDTGFGLLRHVMVRTAHKTGQIMVILVCSSPVFPSKNNFVKALLKKFPEISTIVLNVNEKSTSMVLGSRNITLYGKGFIEDELCGKMYKLSPTSFYQINSVQTEKMYMKAMEYAGLSRKDVVIDAYCGIGTIGLTAADKVKKVIGVELNKDAVKDAVQNAKRNKIENAEFYQNDAGKFMVQMAEQGEHADVVFMDPPRSGSTEEFLDCVMKLAPRKLVYISCGPDTLARDLAYLVKKGMYTVKEITPYDLFPFTNHVETVVLISQLRQKPDDYIHVDVDVTELEGTSTETKATYEKIKKYVAEHNDGMKVSNLYIAQVKRKCGIELAENFNLPKSEDAKQPQCPKEKEEAIMKALRAFKMI